MECSICNEKCVNKRRGQIKEIELFGACCDFCRTPFCRNCSELSVTENDSLALLQRKLTYHCKECKTEILNSTKELEFLKNAYYKCSEEIKERDNLMEENQIRYDDLEEECNKLKAELSERDNYIHRLQRGSRSFEDMACSREEEMQNLLDAQVSSIDKLSKEVKKLKDKIIEEQREREYGDRKIEMLNNKLEIAEKDDKTGEEKLLTLRDQNKRLQQEVLELENQDKELKKRIKEHEDMINQLQLEMEEMKKERKLVIVETEIGQFEAQTHFKDDFKDKQLSDIKNLKEEIKELSSTVKNMHVTIETLNVENDMLARENKKLQNDLFKFASDQKQNSISARQHACSYSNAVASVKANSQNIIKRTKQHKVLILGDDHCRQFHQLLIKSLGHNADKYETITMFKPGASMDSILHDVEGLTESFTCKDYLIVIGGSNDILNGKIPSFKFLLSKMKNCVNTNLFLSSIPYSSKINIKNNDLINKYNIKLRQFLQRFNNCVETQCQFFDINTKKNLPAKKVMASKMAFCMEDGNNLNNLNRNLIFINTVRYCLERCSCY